MGSIKENIAGIRSTIPDNVTIVAAVKTRSAAEAREAIDAGIIDLGHNYVQEARAMAEALGDRARNVRWHMIGHLQSNKINKALDLFSVIQTVESGSKADALQKRAAARGIVLPVFIEINVGEEEAKSGVTAGFQPVRELAVHIAGLSSLKLAGLMTMGPLVSDPEEVRPYFRETRIIFEKLRDMRIPGADLQTLSMGMSDSYRVAIEEGANMIRLGSVLFGPRPVKR
jgi:hypothetical protein